MRTLQTGNVESRQAAVRALGRFGSGVHTGAFHLLIDLLGDNEPLVAAEAARALGQHGEVSLGPLTTALDHAEPLVRREAAAALEKFGPAAEPALPILGARLGDEDSRVRMAAVSAIGALGPAAVSVVPELLRGLRDNNVIFCRLAAQALTRIGDAAVPGLIDALNAPDKYVQREAAWALEHLPPNVRSAHPEIDESLKRRASSLTTTTEASPAADREHSATVVINLEPPAATEMSQTMALDPNRLLSDDDRRGAQRFPADLDAFCQPPPGHVNDPNWFLARVVNVSAGGVGLIASRGFAAQTYLAIELKNESKSYFQVIPARVVHVTRHTDGTYLIGCAFQTELNEEELNALVSGPFIGVTQKQP
jgi:hypothetical protein